MHRAGVLLFVFVAACAVETTPDSLGRPKTSAKAEKSGSKTPSAQPAQPGNSQAPSSSEANKPQSPVPQVQGAPLAKGVCENPDCDQDSCTAKDSQGNEVSLQCQGGLCSCITGNQITDQVGQTDDPKQLFFQACECQ